MRKTIKSMLLIFLSFGASAQSFTLYNMLHSLPQSIAINPAFTPDTRINFGIVSAYMNAGNSFSWKDAVEKTNEGVNITANSIDRLIHQQMGKNNFLNFNQSVEALSIGFYAGDGYISFMPAVKTEFDLNYPRDLIAFLWDGNAELESSTGDIVPVNVELDRLRMRAKAYLEIPIGYNHKFAGNKLSLGVRIKYLKGLADVSSDPFDMSVTTDPDNYFITLSTNGATLNTSNLDFIMDDNFEGDPDIRYFLKSRNSGFAMDFGGTLQLTKKITLSASILDLGYIRWKDNIRNLSLEPEYTFEGIELKDIMGFGDDGNQNGSDAFDQLTDDLEAAFELDTTQIYYTTWLSTKLYAGASYQIDPVQSVSTTIYSEIVQGRVRPALNLAYNVRFGRAVNANISYSIINRSMGNLGLGLSIWMGGPQLYFLFDNALLAVIPQSGRYADFRFGLNFNFGKSPELRRSSASDHFSNE